MRLHPELARGGTSVLLLGGLALCLIVALALIEIGFYRGPWIAGGLVAFILLLAGLAFRSDTFSAQRQRLCLVLSFAPIMLFLVAVSILQRQADEERVTVQGEFRDWTADSALTLGAPGTDFPFDHETPGWGAWRMELRPSDEEADGVRYRIVPIEGVDFLRRNGDVIHGVALKDGDWIRVGEDSLRFLRSGPLDFGSVENRVEWKGLDLPLRSRPDSIFEVDVSGGSSLAELLKDGTEIIPQTLLRVRLLRTRSRFLGRSLYWASHSDPLAFAVDGRQLPRSVTVHAGDTLTVGTGSKAPSFALGSVNGNRFTPIPVLFYHRNPAPLLIQFPGPGQREISAPWRDRVLVSTSALPGSPSIIDLSDHPIGMTRDEVLGRFERGSESWGWRGSIGRDRRAGGVESLLLSLPGSDPDETGLLVTKPQQRLSLLEYLWGISFLQILALVFLVVGEGARQEDRRSPPLFTGSTLAVLFIPVVFMILTFRSIIAARAAYLPPFNGAVTEKALLAWAVVPLVLLAFIWWQDLFPFLRGLLPWHWRDHWRGGSKRLVSNLRDHPARGLLIYALVAGLVLFLLVDLSLTLQFGVLLVIIVVFALALASLVPRVLRRSGQSPASSHPLAALVVPSALERQVQIHLRERAWDVEWMYGATLLFLLGFSLAAARLHPWLGLFFFFIVAAATICFVVYGAMGRLNTWTWLLLAPGAAIVVAGFLFSPLQVTLRFFVLLLAVFVFVREIALMARSEIETPLRRGWVRGVTVSALIVGAVLLVGLSDVGAILYLAPLGLALVIVAGSQGTRHGMVAAVAVVGIAIGAMAIVGWRVDETEMERAFDAIAYDSQELGRSVALVDRATGFTGLRAPMIRLLATTRPDLLERGIAFAQGDDVALAMRRTLEQWWGMRAYGRGGATGLDLGGLQYSGRAVTPPVAVSDNAFSVFVLAEHGWVGGLAYLTLLSILAGLALYAATNLRLPAHRDRVLVTAVAASLGGLLLVPAVYMAAANAVLVPLTGQNVPGLGLNSGADIFLLAIVVGLLGSIVAEGNGSEDRISSLSTGIRVFVILLILTILFAFFKIASAAEKSPPPDLDYGRLDQQIARIGESTLLHVQGDSLRWFSPVALDIMGERSFLAHHVDLHNRYVTAQREVSQFGEGILQPIRSRLRDPSVFAVVPSDRGSTIRGRASAVFGRQTLADTRNASWRGRLVTSDPPRALTILESPHLALEVDPSAPHLQIQNELCRARGRLVGSRFTIMCGDNRVDLIRRDHEVIAAPARRLVIDEKPVSRAVVLSPGMIVDFDGLGRFIVNRRESNVLSRTHWRNARIVRSSEDRLPLADEVARLIDRGVARESGARRNEDVELSLDLALSQRLNHEIAEWMGTYRGEAVRGVGVLVLDASTGSVRALSGWSAPGWRPSSSTCPSTTLTGATPESAPFHLNFTQSPPGSVIKPFIAAAAVHAHPALRTLEVRHPGSAVATSIAGIPIAPWNRWPGLDLATERRCVGSGRWIDLETFLTCSSNLYAATLVFLASAPFSEDTGLPALQSASVSGVRLGADRLPGRPQVAGLADECRPGRACAIANASQLAQSDLAISLERLFGVLSEPSDEIGTYDRSVWNPLVNAGMIDRGKVARNRISPCISRPYVGLVEDTGALARFAVGAGENQWTNVHLAQGFARLLTGRHVEATLVERIGGDPASEVPGPAPGPTHRTAITAGLLGSVEGRGTAATLDSFAESIQKALGETGLPPFDIAAKTGTLSEPATRSLLMGIGLWPEASRMVCGTVVAMRVFFERPRLDTPPAIHLELARDRILPTLAEAGDWSDGQGWSQCQELEAAREIWDEQRAEAGHSPGEYRKERDDGNGSRFIGWIRDGWNGLTDRLARSGSQDDLPGRSARTGPTESPEPDLTPPRRKAPPVADAPDPAWSRDTSLVRDAKCIQGCAEELSLSRLRELTESDSSICAVLVGIQIDISGRPVTTSVLESSGHESCDVAALEWAAETRWEPFLTVGGKPSEGWIAQWRAYKRQGE